MSLQVTANANHTVGTELFLEGHSPSGDIAAVFEDDGETGYFYAWVPSPGSTAIKDALHIYNVPGEADRIRPVDFAIGWFNEGMCAVLLVENRPHAVFDFRAKKGWCRSGFPPGHGGREWSPDGHAWDEAALIGIDEGVEPLG